MIYGSFCVWGLPVYYDLFVYIWMIFVTLLSRALFGEKVRLIRPYFALMFNFEDKISYGSNKTISSKGL